MRARERLVVGRPGVPAIRAAALRERDRVLHERHAAPLDGRGEDDPGTPVVRGPKPLERVAQRGVVVAVARDDARSEGGQLRLEALEREDLLRRAVGLERVAVDHDHEPRDALMGGGLERLPVLALLELAVAGHHDDASAQAEPLLRPRDPPRLRDPHAERARVRLDAGHADVGVPVEPAESPQAQQPLGRHDPERVQRRVETGHVVPLRGEEDVPAGIVEADRDGVELGVEEVHDDVQRAEARAEVAGAGALDGDERVRATHVGQQREPLVARGVCRDALEGRARDEDELGQAADCRSAPVADTAPRSPRPAEREHARPPAAVEGEACGSEPQTLETTGSQGETERTDRRGTGRRGGPKGHPGAASRDQPAVSASTSSRSVGGTSPSRCRRFAARSA